MKKKKKNSRQLDKISKFTEKWLDSTSTKQNWVFMWSRSIKNTNQIFINYGQ